MIKSSFFKASKDFDCCSNFTRGERNVHQIFEPFCAPIEIPVNDQFWGRNTIFNRACHHMIRSKSAPDVDCRPGPSETVRPFLFHLSFIDVKS